ncbi:MAG: hypothetical protein PGN13_12595 [Patulibacter minatonensis]
MEDLPWEPRDLIEEGLRQWLRCAGAALVDDQVIGMPSRAVDELWHGLILCTGRYARFCDAAYGRFLHHHPEDDHAPSDPPRTGPAAGTMHEQLARTVAAWELVRAPREACLLWNLDTPARPRRTLGPRRRVRGHGDGGAQRRVRRRRGHGPQAAASPPVASACAAWIVACAVRWSSGTVKAGKANG